MLNRLSEKFTDVFRKISGKAAISEKNVQDAVEEIKIALLEADVNLRVVRRFVNATLKEAINEKVLRSLSPGQQFTKIVYDKLTALLGDGEAALNLKGKDTQSAILLAGLQGSGKTTTAAKLAYHLKKQGRKPLLVAADLVRPAAIEQLQTLGKNIDIPVYAEPNSHGKNPRGKNSIAVIKNALKMAKKNLHDLIIVDTSGRMNVDTALMRELSDIAAVLKPVETLLIADSMTGQHAVDIASSFNESIELTGVILSKFDSDTRGGAAISLKSVTGKPVKFIGTGEKVSDLEPFIPERIAGRILGMGDVLSLVEKAQETISENDALQLRQKMAGKQFTLNDYLDQFRQVKKMGGLEKIVDFLPAMRGKMNGDQERKITLHETIISSMTKKERQNHLIIGPSRRKRIARGSGTSVHEVMKLLKEFGEMRVMMKKVIKNKKYQKHMLQQFGL